MHPLIALLWVGSRLGHAQPVPLPDVDLDPAVTAALRGPATDEAVLAVYQEHATRCTDGFQRGAHVQALPSCVAVVRLAERARGPDHRVYGSALNNLAAVLQATGEYEASLPLLRRGLAIAEATQGADHPSVATRLVNLATVLRTLGRPAEAEPLARRAIAIAERVHGEASPELVLLLNNLAAVLYATGQLAESEATYRRAVALGDPQDRNVGYALNGLGNVLKTTGRAGEAESALRRSLAIAEATGGPDHPDVGTRLDNLAVVLLSTGRQAEAATLSRRALSITGKTMGLSHPTYGVRLNNLVNILDALGKHEEALPHARRSLAIVEATFGPDHPDVGPRTNNVAKLLERAGRTDEAIELYRKAVRVTERAQGPAHPALHTPLSNLAGLYFRAKRYVEAEPLIRRALAISEAAFGLDHPDVAEGLANLSALLEATGRSSQAGPLLRRSLAIEEADLAMNLLVGTPRAREARLAQLWWSTADAISWHLQRNPDDASAAELALTTWLQRKGRSEVIERSVLSAARSSGDATAQALLERIQAQTAALAAVRSRGPNGDAKQWRAAQDAIVAERSALQRQLVEASPGARQTLRRVDLSSVAATLPPRTRLVEFMVYTPYDPRAGAWDEPRYAAYVLDPAGPVTWADLGPIGPVDRQVRVLRQALVQRAPVAEPARKLFAATLGPLDLDESDHIFVSTDGTLPLVPFEVVVAFGTDRPLAVSYLGSGRELLEPPPRASSTSRSVVVYDVDYDAGPKGATATRRWAPLRHARAEGRAVQRVLEDATTLRGARATETMLRALTHPHVLHVASHGYYEAAPPPTSAPRHLRGVKAVVQDVPSQTYPSTTLPMLTSGIVLAGANRLRTGSDDGLLTAGELTDVDLRGTALVTLSACNTGQGELRTGAGVYGLRRALFLAGSRAQVLSLWEVDDAATAYLMTQFYEALGRGATVLDALTEAQRAVQDRPQWAHPFFWAAFTVSGDPTVRLIPPT